MGTTVDVLDGPSKGVHEIPTSVVGACLISPVLQPDGYVVDARYRVDYSDPDHLTARFEGYDEDHKFHTRDVTMRTIQWLFRDLDGGGD